MDFEALNLWNVGSGNLMVTDGNSSNLKTKNNFRGSQPLNSKTFLFFSLPSKILFLEPFRNRNFQPKWKAGRQRGKLKIGHRVFFFLFSPIAEKVGNNLPSPFMNWKYGFDKDNFQQIISYTSFQSHLSSQASQLDPANPPKQALKLASFAWKRKKINLICSLYSHVPQLPGICW